LASAHYIIPCLFSEPGRPLYLQIECILSTAAGGDPVGIPKKISAQVANLALVKALNLAQGDCNILEPWLSMAIHGYPWLFTIFTMCPDIRDVPMTKSRCTVFVSDVSPRAG
jgi:hypothetical protein